MQVDKLENVEDPRTYAEELQRIVTLYIVEDAPSQVNLSWLTREATEEVARGVIDSVQQVYAVFSEKCARRPDTVFCESGQGVVRGRHQ